MTRPIQPGLGETCAGPGDEHPRADADGRTHGALCSAHRKQLKRRGRMVPLVGPCGKLPGTRCHETGCRRRRNIRGRYCAACKSAWYRRKRKLAS